MVANETGVETLEMFQVSTPRPPTPAEQELAGKKLSADRRRTQRQAQLIAAGVHPLLAAVGSSGQSARLHPLADETATAQDSRGLPYTCGSCRFRALIPYHHKTYPKCLFDFRRTDQDPGDLDTRTLDDLNRVSHGTATDVRAWWPACRDYEAGDTTLSPDAGRVFARPDRP